MLRYVEHAGVCWGCWGSLGLLDFVVVVETCSSCWHLLGLLRSLNWLGSVDGLAGDCRGLFGLLKFVGLFGVAEVCGVGGV